MLDYLRKYFDLDGNTIFIKLILSKKPIIMPVLKILALNFRSITSNSQQSSKILEHQVSHELKYKKK